MIFWPWLIFIAAYGACVGSFLNVVIYRLPEGRSIVSPPSSCPKCGHRLAAYDNVPILGWLWLGGKCRYCRNPISGQYPLVEAATALLFGGLAACYYLTPLWPAWTDGGIGQTWPALLVHLALVAGLLAATVIDYRLYIIPLEIPWVTTAIAVIALPVAAMFLPGMENVSPVADGRWFAAAVGGTGGLIISIILLQFGILPRSFDDENAGQPDISPAQPDALVASSDTPVNHETAGSTPPNPQAPSPSTPEAMPASMPSSAPPTTDSPNPNYMTPEEFLSYPHPRREVAKESLFLALPILGAALAFKFAPVSETALALPLRILGGVLLGYLAGGGMVWATRILGTLGFDKEAMGLGDVHLLAAIGAVLGWRDAGMVFLMAPFLGLGCYAAAALAGRFAKAPVRVIPYGPFIAAAAVALMACHQPIVDFFARLYR